MKQYKNYDYQRQFSNYRLGDYHYVDNGFDDIDLTDVLVEHRHKHPEKSNRELKEHDEWK